MATRTVLGIDPSLRGTGWGIIDVEGQQPRARDYGVIRIPAKRRQSEALVLIHETLAKIISQYQPNTMSVEGVIYLQNYKTAITLGAARAAAILAAAQAGLEIYEYAPRRIKAAATGLGGAQKQQVAFMIRAQLGLRETPPSDAADALAAALAHVQNEHGVSQKVSL